MHATNRIAEARFRLDGMLPPLGWDTKPPKRLPNEKGSDVQKGVVKTASIPLLPACRRAAAELHVATGDGAIRPPTKLVLKDDS